jgi:Kinesin motor domain
MLENAFLGFNTCIFAYGQTGSGKSYSIAGYGDNKGIVPLLCEELFKRADRETKKGVPGGKRIEFKVTFSMLEIYNEVLQDLQVQEKDRVKDGLKVRDTPGGSFVEGLKTLPCTSWAEMEMFQEIGNKNRTLGQTLMNATSSRAHTVN